ncbi:MAG: hypothetical protein JWN86_3922 [Planctomycetota bacterium]|nr:hypothetical protein [Planctomycetota bacterium]
MNKYAFARSLQLLGLIVAPLGIAAELNDQIGLGTSLMIGGIGVLIFFVGHSLQPKRP